LAAQRTTSPRTLLLLTINEHHFPDYFDSVV
jgi:hypothetical protein